jgi:uncharacterized protein YjiS (DUF1127 family)
MPCADKTCCSTIVGPTSTGQLRSPAHSLDHWVAFAIRCRERRRQRQALSQLDDRMLVDIGISRSQAIEEASKPFWK